jgi:TetR/AcrR family transcriptional regulator, transcriptional repressor of bet genes
MPKIVDHVKRRAELAEAAWRTIARHGIEQTTTRTVAREAGCSTGAIAHYFKGKEALLRAALEHSYAENDAAMAEHAANPGLETIRHLLVNFLPVTDERRQRWALWLAFASRAAADPKTLHELVKRYDAWRDLVKRSLVEAQERGEMPAELDPKSEAQVLVAFVDGIGRQAALEPKRWPRRLLLQTVDRYLARLSVELREAA